MTDKSEPFYIIFDGPPGRESGRFVEVETADGQGRRVGEWAERPDGLWALGPVYAHPEPASASAGAGAVPGPLAKVLDVLDYAAMGHAVWRPEFRAAAVVLREWLATATPGAVVAADDVVGAVRIIHDLAIEGCITDIHNMANQAAEDGEQEIYEWFRAAAGLTGAAHDGYLRTEAEVRAAVLEETAKELESWAEQAYDQTETGAWLRDTYQRAADCVRALAKPDGGQGD
jgi:hypothetical protein